GGLGLIVTVLGSDPVMGQERLTLGIDFVKGGIDFLPVLIGVFAFAQIMGEIERSGGKAQLAGSLERGVKLTVSHAKVIWEILSRPFQLLWFAFVGVLIGVLPAIGASAARMMAYVHVLLVFGVLGYLMVKFGFPLAPFILGVILGDQIEINLVRSIMTDSNPWLFITWPISGGLLLASVLSVLFALWQHRRMQKKTAAADGDADF